MDRALLKCNGENEMVTVNNHVYPIVKKYLFIDVRPYRTAPRFIANPDPYAEQRQVVNPLCDPLADAEVDATAICAITTRETLFGVAQTPYRLFEPPTKDERDTWLALPGNLARWEGSDAATAPAPAPALTVIDAVGGAAAAAPTPPAKKVPGVTIGTIGAGAGGGAGKQD